MEEIIKLKPKSSGLKDLKFHTNEKLHQLNKNPFTFNFSENLNLGNIPIHEISKLFNPFVKVNELNNGNKPFLESLLLFNKNANIEFTLLSNPAVVKIHRYFYDSDYTKNIFVKGPNSEEFNTFCYDFIENFNDNFMLEYKYYFFHTVENPMIFGPKSLYVTEKWKVYFISPLCIIVEQKIKCSGFFLVDSFYLHYRFKFESDILFEEGTKYEFYYTTHLTTEFNVVIVKENYLSSTISKRAIDENRIVYNDKFLPTLKKVWERSAFDFYCDIFHDYYANKIKVEELPLGLEMELREIKCGKFQQDQLDDNNLKIPQEKNPKPNDIHMASFSSVLDDLKSLISLKLLVFLLLIFIFSKYVAKDFLSNLDMLVILFMYGLFIIWNKLRCFEKNLGQLEKVISNNLQNFED